MTSRILIHGLPERLRLDSWWFSEDLGSTSQNLPRKHWGIALPSGRIPVFAIAVGLTVLADWLFWEQEKGLSIAIFALVLSAVMLWLAPVMPSGKKWLAGMGLAVVSNLPMVELLQPLSVMFSGLGILALAVWLSVERFIGWMSILRGIAGLVLSGPLRVIQDMLRFGAGFNAGPNIGKRLLGLLLPLGLGAVFIGLLAVANPFLEQFLNMLAEFDPFTPDVVLRMFFWMLVLVLIWPYLNLTPFRWIANLKKPKPRTEPAVLGSIISPQSVRVSLLLFNSIFAVQTGLDILVLSGGMALPEGMSYASYAHRGAYPLVVTALLAGGFAVGTGRMIVADRFLRGLVYLWMAQNLFLVLTAGFRLNLYIESFALTRLRIAAFIWMFLVFAGLVLILIQISKRKSVSWLVLRNGVLLFAVLYVCSFVNFAFVIADYNVKHTQPQYVHLDQYTCVLGAQALPVILGARAYNPLICAGEYLPEFTQPTGWRDWGFRNWRLNLYLINTN